MTDAELDEIAKRADAATEGPWVVWQSQAVVFTGPAKTQERHGMTFPTGKGQEVAACDTECVERDANAVLVAHARTDVPKLVDEVRRLKTALASIDAVLSTWRDATKEPG